jgi:membrane-bound ClpP family serine protease
MGYELLLIIVGVVLLVVGYTVPMAPPGARICQILGILLLVLGVLLLVLPGLPTGPAVDR